MPALKERLDGRILALETLNPWTNLYGLARSLLALGPLLTLTVTSTDTLFHPVRILDSPRCDGPAEFISLFCVLPLGFARAVAVAVLVLVVVGWRPRWTAIPHWLISFGVQASISLPEGGDQAASNLALLLLPVALTDRRRTHWSPPDRDLRPVASFAANVGLFLVRVQVMVIYLQAFIAKLFVPEWVDGTAVWYWLTDPNFGPPGIRRTVALTVASTPLGITLLTWGTLVVEALLAFGFLATAKTRYGLLVVGILFHGLIAAAMGLVSFTVVMWGALLLYLWPRSDRPSIPLQCLVRRKEHQT